MAFLGLVNGRFPWLLFFMWLLMVWFIWICSFCLLLRVWNQDASFNKSRAWDAYKNLGPDGLRNPELYTSWLHHCGFLARWFQGGIPLRLKSRLYNVCIPPKNTLFLIHEKQTTQSVNSAGFFILFVLFKWVLLNHLLPWCSHIILIPGVAALYKLRAWT